MEADKSMICSWQARGSGKPMVPFQSVQERQNQENWWCPSLEAGEDQCPSSETTGRGREFFPTWAFTLCRPSAAWMRPIHLGEGEPLTLPPILIGTSSRNPPTDTPRNDVQPTLIQMGTSSRNPPTDTPRNDVQPTIWAPCGPVKLAPETNHVSWPQLCSVSTLLFGCLCPGYSYLSRHWSLKQPFSTSYTQHPIQSVLRMFENIKIDKLTDLGPI